jgi:hypothetical protein
VNLEIMRLVFDNEDTIGKLYVEDAFNCYTLELPYNLGRNKPDTDCIPFGNYQVGIDYSPHFGRYMPILLNVPGRSEIRIHPANMPTQLLGCIAVGSYDPTHPDWISSSRAAFDPLYMQIQQALMSGSVSLNITDGRNSPPTVFSLDTG